MKESGVIKPKGTTLDRAIQELEKVVTECKLLLYMIYNFFWISM